MNVTVIDELGQEHVVEAVLTGICPDGHDCYIVIVPFPIDGKRAPTLRLDEQTINAHIQVVGIGVTADGGSHPWATVWEPIAVNRGYERWTRLTRLLLTAMAVMQGLLATGDLIDGEFTSSGIHVGIATVAVAALAKMRP